MERRSQIRATRTTWEQNSGYQWVNDIDSESTLDERIETLKKLAPRAGVSNEKVERAVSVIKERIAAVAEETKDEKAPDFEAPKKDERDTFGDDELHGLFYSLLAEPK